MSKYRNVSYYRDNVFNIDTSSLFLQWCHKNVDHTTQDLINTGKAIDLFLRDVLTTQHLLSPSVSQYSQNHKLSPHPVPDNTFEYWIITKFSQSIDPDIPILNLICHNNVCMVEKEYNTAFSQLSQQNTENTQCWPFYIDIEYGRDNHRICGYYFEWDAHIYLLDSSCSDPWYSQQLISILENFFPNTNIEYDTQFTPQATQIIKKHLITNISPYFIKDSGTCAIWARFMFIIGKFAGATLSIQNYIYLRQFLISSIFLLPNFIVLFQVYAAKIIEKYAQHDFCSPIKTLRRSIRHKK